MDVKTLKQYREDAGLSQCRAAELISPIVKQAYSTVRRSIIKAEREGTGDLDLIDAMSVVYDAPMVSLLESNKRLRSVQEMLQNPCTVCT